MMFDIFGMLKRILKGEVAFNIERGEIVYRGNRIIAMSTNLLDVILNELKYYFGDASVIVLEKLGEAVGKTMRQSMGWSSAEEVLKQFPEVAKVAGYGIVNVSGDTIRVENLPIVLNEELARHIAGLLRGLCLELVDLKYEGRSLYAKYKTLC